MKKKITILFLCGIIAGCAAPRNPQADAYRSYIAVNKPLAEQGAMKWSDYYSQAYQHALPLQSPLKPVALEQFSKLIGHAKDYEAGKISKEQFEFYRREAQIAQSRAEQDLDFRMKQQQQISDASTTGAAMQLLQMGQPHTLAPASPPSTMTNCRSVYQGMGVVQTVCN